MDRSRLVDERVAGDDERVLREEARQLLRLVGEEDPAAAAAGDVAQQLGVLVALGAEAAERSIDAIRESIAALA